MVAIVAAEWVVLAAVVAGGFRDVAALPLHLTLITALDALLIWRIYRIEQTHKGRALWVVAAAFGAAVASNLCRLAWQLSTGQPVPLNEFNLLSRIAFIVNFTGVIFYSFGYWGFVLEKSHARMVAALADRQSARIGELNAIERERAVQQLLRERESLIARLAVMQRAAQAGALSASIAHEINQPLAAIRLDLEQAKYRMAGSLSPAADLQLGELVDRSLSQTLRAARMVKTLRDVFSARELAAAPRPIDEAIGSVADFLRRSAKEHQVQLHFELADGAFVNTASGELEHVVLNLVVNALQAAQHAPRGVPSVVVSTLVAGQWCLLRVADNGPGIDVSLTDHLFELLHTTKANAEGMGLGLWLSRHIVERHGGRITLERTVHGDTRFIVELPLARA